MNNSLLTFLGNDSGFGTNNNSAYIESDNNLYIIDCGFTVFNQIKEKFNFHNYNNIYIIITHLHNDHAGSLSQLILYLYFLFNKKTIIVSKCSNIKDYLNITGTPEISYTLYNSLENLNFIKTEHTPYLDAYGFEFNINNQKIIYTGDTSTLVPFLPYLEHCNELYVDVSKSGGAHLKFDEIYNQLIDLKTRYNIRIFLMHIDDKTYINQFTKYDYEI